MISACSLDVAKRQRGTKIFRIHVKEDIRNPSFAQSHANPCKTSHVNLSWKTDFLATIASQI